MKSTSTIGSSLARVGGDITILPLATQELDFTKNLYTSIIKVEIKTN